jgi:hypothetical protein
MDQGNNGGSTAAITPSIITHRGRRGEPLATEPAPEQAVPLANNPLDLRFYSIPHLPGFLGGNVTGGFDEILRQMARDGVKVIDIRMAVVRDSTDDGLDCSYWKVMLIGRKIG